MPASLIFPRAYGIEYDGTNSAEVIDFVDNMPDKTEQVTGSSVDGSDVITITFTGGPNLVINPSDWVIGYPTKLSAVDFAKYYITQADLLS
jgi:hypothetical protein